jgi:hypothetical protein
MKNRQILMAALSLVLLLTACQKIVAKKPISDQPVAQPPAVQEPVAVATDLEKSCATAKGNWLADYKECENAGKDWCDSNKGVFNECGSACRHDPKAQVCTMNCVPVCSFGSPSDTSKPVAQVPPVAKPPLVGGDRDAHGCLGSGGYQWCEAKSKCLRIWEEPCEGSADSSKCALETCHGLDIACGSNPPMVCTDIYGMGDRCLKYAKCGVQDGKCQQVQDPKFTDCKACVQKCIDGNKNDPAKSFECEGKCG